ncbi:MAG: SCP2 sterol-binding domain-containing protein [Sulfurihydrogenibium sp.]
MYKKFFVLTLSLAGFSCTADPWMGPEWTKKLCDYWNQNLQTTMAEWAEYNVKKDKGYKTIQFYRQDCNPHKKVELRIKYENGKAVCIYGGEAKDPNPEFVMYATDKNWKSLANGEFGFMGMGIISKMTFQGSKVEAMKFMEPFKSFLTSLGKVPYSETCP